MSGLDEGVRRALSRAVESAFEMGRISQGRRDGSTPRARERAHEFARHVLTTAVEAQVEREVRAAFDEGCSDA